MRNQQNKRMRGRNRKSHNPLTRVYESNGPDVKIQGTASYIAEKYLQRARDAQSGGDPVAAENYLQHAEHYFRLIAAAQEQFRQTSPSFRDGMGDDGDDGDVAMPGAGEQPTFGPRDPQPYLPRDAQFFPQRDQPNYGGGRHSRDSREPRESSRDFGGSKEFAAKDKDDDSAVDRLPSFITGGAAGPQNGQNGAGHGQNGFEGQADRFPLHRRRRRHRNVRGDAAGAGEGDEAMRSNGSGE